MVTASYWSHRLATASPMNAVLEIGASEEENQAHHRWESDVIARFSNANTVLDLASGWCRLSAPLVAETVKVTAVDLSPAMLAAAPEGITKIVGDVTTLDLNQRFDLVLCFGIMEHLRPEQRASLMDVIARHVGGMALMLVNSDDLDSAPVEKPGYYSAPARLQEMTELAQARGLRWCVVAERPQFRIITLRSTAW